MTGPANRPDNRSAQRVMTVFKAARIAGAGSDDLGLIRNISTAGVMVETRLALRVDDAIVLEIQSGRPISGRVRWTKDGMAGIQLDRPIDLAVALGNSAPGDVVDRSRPPRFDRVAQAALQSGGQVWQAATRNISLSGAQIDLGGTVLLAADTPAMLRIDALGTFGGTVRWQRGGAIGIRFDQPIALRQFQQWLHRFGDPRPTPPSRLRAV